jgi:hypothetical protein
MAERRPTQKSACDTYAPSLGLDLDGTIDENPAYFSALSHSWPGRVVIVTCRDDLEDICRDLAEFGVCYDEVVAVSEIDKSAVLVEKQIDVFIDDQDECMMCAPACVTLLKIRNQGNSEGGRWLYSNKTGVCL